MQIDAVKHWSFLAGSIATSLEDQDYNVIRFDGEDGTWFLKQRPTKDLCEKELAVTALCEAKGLPVACALPTDDGKSCLHLDDKWWMLTRELPGRAPEEITRDVGKDVGTAIARFQNVFLGEPLDNFPDFDTPFERLLRRLERLGDREPDSGRLKHMFLNCPGEEGLAWGLIHRDPHDGNMRFENGKLTGLFDFDQTRRGPLIYDPCYASTCRLHVAWTEEDKPELWLEYFSGLMQEYFANAQVQSGERKRIFDMLLQVQLKWVIWLRETGQNEAAETNKRHLLWIAARKLPIDQALVRIAPSTP